MRVLRPSTAVAAAAAVVVAVVAFVSCGSDAPDPTPPPSSPALLVPGAAEAGLPDSVAALPATDVAGFDAILEGLRGTPVVVNLWASWCEPCTREMPLLAEAARANPDVQFVGVDSLDAREGAEDFIAEHGVPFPSLFDPDGAINTDLGGTGLPHTFFFDAAGEQVGRVDGELRRAALDEQLDAIAG